MYSNCARTPSRQSGFIIFTVKRELNQLSQDIYPTDTFYSKEFVRLKDRLFTLLGIHPAI